MTSRVLIKRLPSGVDGLDEVLGGGVPEFSFNLIAGGPGCGKTTLAHQIMFANATRERPALYITVLGEPPVKMLRYQQQYDFFDARQIGDSVRFLHLGVELLEGGVERVLDRIIAEVEATSPGLVFVDSFRALSRRGADTGSMDLHNFVQRLSLHLTTWEATTFLIGEYVEHERDSDPVFTVADGVVWLRQSAERSSIVRRVQIVKARGQRQIPGLHTFRISSAGLCVYPRLLDVAPRQISEPRARLATGIAGLDEMLGGGIPEGYSTVVVGPPGSGKSLLSTQFILEGITRGEPGVIAVFEKRPEEYLQTLPDGKRLADLIAAGSLRMMYLRPLDLSVEETTEALTALVREIGAKRVAIDSLSGFELALAPTYREDFRESFYRMLSALSGLGVTVVLTGELVDSLVEQRLSPSGISFLTDAIILQRYVEVEGLPARALSVVKMRGCWHSSDVRIYEIDAGGIKVGAALERHGQALAEMPHQAAVAQPGPGTLKKKKPARPRAKAGKRP
jgi:circadian clock protein KaiC